MARILRRRVVKPTRAPDKRVSPQEINQWLQLGLSTAKIAEALIPDDPTVSKEQMHALIRARMAGADAPPSAAKQYVQGEISGQSVSTPDGGGPSQPSPPLTTPAAPVPPDQSGMLADMGSAQARAPSRDELIRAEMGRLAAAREAASTETDILYDEMLAKKRVEEILGEEMREAIPEEPDPRREPLIARAMESGDTREEAERWADERLGFEADADLEKAWGDMSARPGSPEAQAVVKSEAKRLVEAPKAATSADQAVALYDNLVEASGPNNFFERLGFGMGARMDAVNKAFMANLNKSPLARKGSGAELNAAVRLITQKRREVEAAKARTGRADLQEAAIEGRRVGRERIHVLRGEYAAARDVSKKAGKDYTQKLRREIEGLKYGNRKRLANHKNSLTRGDMGIRAWWKLLGRPDKPTGNDKLILDGRKYLQKKLTGAITTQTAKLEAIAATDVYVAAALTEAKERTDEQNKAIEQARMQLIFVDAARKEYTDQRATILRLAGEAGYQNPPTIPELPKYELPPGLGESTSSEWLEMDDD